jgi:3-carboxy-cis,cis-muconate cycloisomerase
MPQKRNPTASAAALACASLAAQFAATVLAAQAGHEHERATGAWQTEWPTFPALLLVSSGALAAAIDIGEGLEVDADRMRANLDSTRGLVMAEAVAMALGVHMGKQEAHQIVARAARTALAHDKHLREILTADARANKLLSPADLDRLFDPMAYQGVAQTFIDRIVAGARKERS